MKTQQLMLGDWVSHNGTPKTVDVIWGKEVSLDDPTKVWGSIYTDKFNEDEIEPIPLTPEILKKNGFTGGEYKSWTGDVWYLEEEGFRKIGLTMSRKESTLWGEKIKPLYPDSIGHNFSVPNIKFVHELQHALRLCGINKEIKI